MDALNRRDAVKQVAGLAAGTAVGIGAGNTPLPAAEPAAAKPTDHFLAMARQSLDAFWFTEEVTFPLEKDAVGRELVIEPALDEFGRSITVRVRSRVARVFRADAMRDEFTKAGGLYWRAHNQSGRIQFPQPGALVMVVRDPQDVVRCYALEIDLRC